MNMEDYQQFSRTPRDWVEVGTQKKSDNQRSKTPPLIVVNINVIIKTHI